MNLLIEYTYNIISPIFTLATIATAHHFYKKNLLKVSLHMSSEDSYAFVLDSERYASNPPYYIQAKVTLDILAGKHLGLEQSFLILENDSKLWKIKSTPPNAPKNVRNFFGDNVSDQGQSPVNSKRSTIHGVAEDFSEPFPNRPVGNYKAFAVLVLENFTVTVPLKLASLNDGTSSRICGNLHVQRRADKSTQPTDIVKKYPEELLSKETFSQMQICILDLDSIPLLSNHLTIHLKNKN